VEFFRLAEALLTSQKGQCSVALDQCGLASLSPLHRSNYLNQKRNSAVIDSVQ